MANIVEQAIIELQSVYKGGGAAKAKKDLKNLKQEINNANGSVKRLQNSLKQLNKVPIAFDDKRSTSGQSKNPWMKANRADAIVLAQKALKEYFSTIQTGKRQLAATEAGLKAQAAAFSNVAANAKRGGELYTGAINSQVRAEQKLRLAQLERLKVEQDLFSKGRTTKNDAFKGVDELLSMGNKLPRTIGALSLYKTELEQTLRVVEIGSDKYKALEKAIEGTDQKMKGQQKKKGGLAGLADNLAEAKKEQKGLTALSDEWFDATVRVKKAQFEYNKELFRSRIGTARINEDINGTVRALNLAKQAAKGGLGILGGVAGAVGGAGKKALGTRFGQIGAARGIDALAKKVPVVDKAFGGLLRKIPLLGKFLNENISVNARWSAQILEGITGVTFAWNGLNKIISAAQAFTAFERQAAIAINSVARMFKEMYNVAGAMMMGLISPGQVGKNLWSQANDRPDVMAARRGPSRLEQRELDQAALKSKIKNAEVNEVQLIEGLNRKLLEVERAITEETRERILIRNKEQESLMKGPVWTRYGSPAGPGSKGAGVLSNMEDKLGETRIRLAEKVTAEGKEYESVAKSVVQQETRINAELQEREAIYKRLQQGAPLTSSQQAEARTSLAAQRETEGIDFRGRTVSRRGFQRYQKMRQGRRDRRQRLNENLMLGAGFPMLFGGGLGGIAGGVGGAIAQSKMGTKGGFGAQIILSALGQKFDQVIGQMIGSTQKLGNALGQYTQDTGQLVQSLGLAGTAEGQRIKIIEELQGANAAFTAAMQQLTNAVGKKGVADLKKFGDNVRLIGSEMRIFFTKVQAGLAGILNLADKILRLSQGAKESRIERFAETTDNAEIVALRKRRDEILEGTGGGRSGAKRRGEGVAKIEEQMAGLAAPALAQQDAAVAVDTIMMKQKEMTKSLEEEFAIHSKILELKKNKGLTDELAKAVAEEAVVIDRSSKALQEKLNELTAKGKELSLEDKELQKAIKEALDGQGEALDNIINKKKAINKEDEKNKVTIEDIKEKIAVGLQSAIEGLIEGTKTLGESLASIAKSIGSMFLQAGIKSWIGGMNFGGTTAPVSDSPAKYFASGGYVTRPTVGLVAEAGEDEYIIPSSKMQGAMQRYSAGARGQGVIPGSGTVASGSGVPGGSVQIDYTGPVLNFNSEEFVPRSAIPEIVNSAARKGASAGSAQVFSQMRNSRSTRSRMAL